MSEEEKKSLGVKDLNNNLKSSLQDLKDDHEFLLEGDVFSREVINNYIKITEKEAEKLERSSNFVSKYADRSRQTTISRFL